MAYQSLYRRYRSQKFSEILGQPHVTSALRGAVAENRHGHAYLFSGPRGTGKTSTARVLAKALNCENVADGEPCSTCDSCVAIEEGRSFDLHELDAASHNKVDDVRDLISKVQLGSPGRTKVYILDEVHMLSSGAENALLKTLEEPPEHVVFVLATTEPQKVVATIRSRTQHHEFHLLPAEVLAEHVRWVIEDAGLDVDEEAIDFVLRQGGGSARDTLSSLDLVASAGGVPEGSEVAESVLRAIGDQDPARAIATVQEGLELGREPRTIGEDLLELLRNAFLASMGAPLEHLSDGMTATATELSQALGAPTLTRALEAIGQTLIEMRQAADPRVPLEVTLLRLTRSDRPGAAPAPTAPPAESGPPPPGSGSGPEGSDPAAAARIDALEARVAELEARLVEALASTVGTSPTAPADTARRPAPPRPGRANRRPPTGSARSGDQASAPTPDPSDAPDPAGSPGPTAPTATPAGADGNGSGSDGPDTGAGADNGTGHPDPAAGEPDTAAGAADTGPGSPQTATPSATPAPTAAPAPTTAGGAELTTGEVTSVLAARLDDLSQKVRVRFKGGQVLGVTGDQVRFGVPNSIHRDRCDDVKDEVEAALSEHFGRPVTMEVVVDDNSAPPPDLAKLEPRTPPPTDDDAAVEDIGPVEDLADANDQATGGVDRLTKAFPGSKVIESPNQ